MTAEYRAMAKSFFENGMYDTSYLYYAVKIAFLVSFLSATVWLTLNGFTEGLWAAVPGFTLALFWHQAAFVVHDALHNGITHSLKTDHLIGWLFGSVGIAIPAIWWADNHHMHHAVTNVVHRSGEAETEVASDAGSEADDESSDDARPVAKQAKPGLSRRQTAGAARAAQEKEMMSTEKPPFDQPAHWNGGSAWHGDPQMIYTPIWFTDRTLFRNFTMPTIAGIPLGKILLSIQHITFLPLHLIVGRWNIYVLGAINVLMIGSLFEILGLVLYWAWFIKLASYFTATSTGLAAFLLVSHTLAGTMHLQLNLTHFAQPMLPPKMYEEYGFVKAQLLTSRNIDANVLTHWFHGGLEFQNEHHLFPMVPRHNLGRLSALVRPFCDKHNIPYQSMGFFQAIFHILGDLRSIASDPLGDN